MAYTRKGCFVLLPRRPGLTSLLDPDCSHQVSFSVHGDFPESKGITGGVAISFICIYTYIPIHIIDLKAQAGKESTSNTGDTEEGV